VTAPGELNRRLTLQAPVETDDGAGGVTRSYAAVTTLWAKVQPVSAQSDVSADRLGAALRLRIVIRARDDLTTRHRFTEGARIYRVLAVQPTADRRFLTIEAEARGD
jgi:SPP1 family predicted phage head-tail adaptor